MRWTISYAPSATVLTYLRKQPHPDAKAGLLALGDPVFAPDETPADPGPLPDHGLLLTTVVPGSNAAQHGLQPDDVLLTYNGTTLEKREDLKTVAVGKNPIPVEVWRDGQDRPSPARSRQAGRRRRSPTGRRRHSGSAPDPISSSPPPAPAPTISSGSPARATRSSPSPSSSPRPIDRPGCLPTPTPASRHSIDWPPPAS